LMDPHEIAAAFEQLKKEGKVRFFGVSNFTPSQVDMLASFTRLVNNQVEISILKWNAFTDGTIDKCWQHGLIPTAWSPFAGGHLFSKPDDLRYARIRKTAKEIAEKYNAPLEQIYLAFLMKHPIGIVPVVGTSKTERLRSALKAVEINLTYEEWYRLRLASAGAEVA
ncbi:MAG TPA: oxidoreductase, partial [Bacteroidetes bacterium]|nr:oxidoreductase [Bacteroidota bacterium]